MISADTRKLLPGATKNTKDLKKKIALIEKKSLFPTISLFDYVPPPIEGVKDVRTSTNK